jgi:uncharacterized protein (DUF697 family)
MGTSSSYGGPTGGTPLVPSWLAPGAGSPTPAGAAAPAAGAAAPVATPPATAVAGQRRFATARGALSTFARSGGTESRSLGRSVAAYVGTASGGAATAALRMGASRPAGAGLLSFLNDVQTRGVQQALRAVNLDALVGRPADEVFLALADLVCPEAGTIDAGIAREAWVEMIVELDEQGFTDLDGLTVDQMQTVFEIYATHAIEARLCNDIGGGLITLSPSVLAAGAVERQLRDFIRRGVADALTAARAALQALTSTNVQVFVESVYKSAFELLETLGVEEDEQP